MNSKRLRQTLLLVLMSISLTGLCLGQEAKVVKQLDAHSYVVEIGGKLFKAVDNDLLNEQARSFDTLTAERDAARKDVVKADEQITVLKSETQKLTFQRDDVRTSLQDARVFIAQQKTLLDQETQLRRDVQQFTPHGEVSGWAGKVLKIMDSPAFQFVWKTVPPAYQMMRCQ